MSTLDTLAAEIYDHVCATRSKSGEPREVGCRYVDLYDESKNLYRSIARWHMAVDAAYRPSVEGAPAISETPKSYGPNADAFLLEFYDNAVTPVEKIEVMETFMNCAGQSNYSSSSGPVTDEMKLGCLEYDFLSRCGLIELPLV